MYWHRHNKVLAPLFLEGYERYNDTLTACFEEATTTAGHGKSCTAYPLQTDAWTVGAKEVAQDRLGVDTAMNCGPSTPVMDIS